MSKLVLDTAKMLIHKLHDDVAAITAEEKEKLLQLYVLARNGIDSELHLVIADLKKNLEEADNALEELRDSFL